MLAPALKSTAQFTNSYFFPVDDFSDEMTLKLNEWICVTLKSCQSLKQCDLARVWSGFIHIRMTSCRHVWRHPRTQCSGMHPSAYKVYVFLSLVSVISFVTFVSSGFIGILCFCVVFFFYPECKWARKSSCQTEWPFANGFFLFGRIECKQGN